MGDAIIVGVTDAAASGRAVQWAAARAAALGQRLVLHVIVGGAIGAVGEQDVLDGALGAARAHAESVAASLAADGVTVQTRVGHGDPVALLIEASADAALLVIGGEPHGHGRHGRHGARIAAGAHCPVVVVPAADDAARRGVLVGVDGSDPASAAVRFAADEAVRAGEPLRLLSAWLPVAVPGDFGAYPEAYLTDLAGIAEANLEQVTAGLAQTHPTLEVVVLVEEGDPAQAIASHATDAALVVVGSHGRSGFARFLLGSVSEAVLSHLAAVTAVVR